MNHLPESLDAYRWFSRDLIADLAPDAATLPAGLSPDHATRAVLARLQASGFAFRPANPYDSRLFDAIALHPDREHTDVAEEMLVRVAILNPAQWESVVHGISRHAPEMLRPAVAELRRRQWPGPLLMVLGRQDDSNGHYYAELFTPTLLQKPDGA